MSDSTTKFNQWRQLKSDTMDPSKAWIRNLGLGTTNRRKFNKYRNAPVENPEPSRTPICTGITASNHMIDKAVNDFKSCKISSSTSKSKSKSKSTIKPSQSKDGNTLTLTQAQLMEIVQRLLEAARKENEPLEAVTSSGSREFLHPVYMCEKDFKSLMESGHIVSAQGKFQYKNQQSEEINIAAKCIHRVENANCS